MSVIFGRAPRASIAWTLLLSLVFAALAACTVGPNFARPQPPNAASFGEEKPSATEPEGILDGLQERVGLDKTVAGAWWSLLGSETLNTMIEQAIAGNHDLAAAKATLAQAQELTIAQGGALYPQVGLSAGSGRQKYGEQFLGGTISFPPFTYFSLGPTISYALDYTGGVARSIEKRRAQADFQRYQLAATYLTLTGAVVMQALSIASARAEMTTVEDILNQDRANLTLVQSSFEAGAVSRVDVLSAESQMANDATLLPSLRQQQSVARHALSILLGKFPGSWSAPDIDLNQFALAPVLPVSLPSELVHQRPDILAAEAQLHSATAAVGVATSNLYPRILLSASTGPQSSQFAGLFEASNNAWSLIASITAPIFDAGTLHAQRRAAIDAMHAQASNYQQTVLVAFGQVADLLDALFHDSQELDAQSRAQAAAQENVRFARESYQEGNIGILVVLDAERSSQQTRLGYVRAQAQRFHDMIQLILALGGTAPDGELPTHAGQYVH
jgi:NodT family efflux transporter outer membrane factor (OMF) lipoprotein